jgi:hypothetical protein
MVPQGRLIFIHSHKGNCLLGSRGVLAVVAFSALVLVSFHFVYHNISYRNTLCNLTSPPSHFVKTARCVSFTSRTPAQSRKLTRYDILVLNAVGQGYLLRMRRELAGAAPHDRIPEVRCEAAVDAVTHVFDCGSLAHAYGVRKVWVCTPLLRVHAHEPERFPDPVDEIREVKLELARDDDGVRRACELVDLLEGDCVGLVVNVCRSGERDSKSS